MLIKNKLSDRAYFWWSILIEVLILAAIFHFCFEPLNGMSLNGSIWLLVIGIGFFTIVGVLMSSSKGRNWTNAVMNSLLPACIYCALMVAPRFAIWYKGIAVITFISAVLIFLMIVCRRLPHKCRADRGEIIKKRIVSGLFSVRVVVVALLVFCLLVTGIGSWVESISANNAAADMEQWTMRNNKEAVLKLRSEVWDSLSVDERLEVMEVVKNIEMRYLGVQRDIDVEVGELDEFVLGAYRLRENKIIISESHIKHASSYDVLHTLIHECHHAYTNEQVEALMCLPESYRSLRVFNAIRVYKEEYSDYTGGGEDYLEYCMQLCELEAEKYAEESVEEYCVAIEEYEKEMVNG